ncbi:DUF4232 domain-containing protein [Kitasatospora sp. NPDC051914]|uniref:DUF4232 domain-containing protein n=1 Tax=Kitasatospora sp. NPDC051914 TaxID=3154945 RepID=UPI00343EFE0C
MNPHLSRLTLAAVTTVALGLGAVACTGADTDPAPSKTAAGAATAAGTASGGGTGGAAGASPARSSAAPVPATTGGNQAASRCHTSELKADVQIQPDHPGSAMVMLVNKGTRSCTVFGYLGFGGLLADNSRLDVTTARVAQPGPPTQITLKPGTTAFSGLTWAPCDKSDTNCRVLSGLVVTPPDETTQLTATVLGTDGKTVPQLTVSATGLKTGTLQPSNQGVLLP